MSKRSNPYAGQIETVERVATVPGVDAGAPISVTVTLYRVLGVEMLFKTRAAAIDACKAKRRADQDAARAKSHEINKIVKPIRRALETIARTTRHRPNACLLAVKPLAQQICTAFDVGHMIDVDDLFFQTQQNFVGSAPQESSDDE